MGLASYASLLDRLFENRRVFELEVPERVGVPPVGPIRKEGVLSTP